jgi:GcrA cell cycle regulator
MRPEIHHLVWDNAETMSLFRSLWDQGLSTQRIADRLGVTKNSVVGKAHRMHVEHPEMFAPRPSPILNRTGKPPGAKTIKQAPSQTLPAITTRLFEIKQRVVAIRAPTMRCEPCNYPISTGSFPRYEFCGIPSVPGKPYCAHHCLSCYVAINSEAGKAIRKAWSAIPPVWSGKAA